MKSTATDQHETPVEAWKAVVLYTDAQSGTNAQKLLSRVARNTRSGDAWQTNLWRFDVMSEQPVAAQALHDAGDAQLIFLSAQSISEPPGWLLDWLRAWVDKRRGKKSAVAAWCQHSPQTRSSSGVESLRQFARENGLTFLCANDFAHRTPA